MKKKEENGTKNLKEIICDVMDDHKLSPKQSEQLLENIFSKLNKK